MIRPQLLMRMARGPRVAVIALVALVALYNGAAAQNLAFSLFERYLESLRVQVGIPGLSAAILQDGQMVWERGFGMADLETSIAARPDTPYLVGDLTQVFTTLLLAQCAERGAGLPRRSDPTMGAAGPRPAGDDQPDSSRTPAGPPGPSSTTRRASRC